MSSSAGGMLPNLRLMARGTSSDQAKHPAKACMHGSAFGRMGSVVPETPQDPTQAFRAHRVHHTGQAGD